MTMLFPGRHLCGRLFPNDLAAFVDRSYREKGIELRPNLRVTGIEGRGVRYEVSASPVDDRSRSEQLEADIVVAGIGVTPNVDLVVQAGLVVADGIVVDEGLRTSNRDIFAAGDVASFSCPALGRRIRVEHEDNDTTMGYAAGEAMTGSPIRYEHLPSFSSDLFDLGYEAAGDLDSALETVADWREPLRKGIVYYLRDGSPVGVLLWNVWDELPFARAIISEKRPVDGLIPRASEVRPR